MLINNKMKQAAMGNWGSDKYTKEHTEVKVSVEEPEEVKYVKPKKGKKHKKKEPYVYPGDLCPHCKAELPDDEKELAKPENKWRRGLLGCKVKNCPACGAYEVPQCPACKNSAWYSPRNRWYKHKYNWGCGFEGMKKQI